ncbi:MAG: hypothetical protein K5773_03080 [Pseudobutyrivibrio sp.]|nr:hypothetical protein [Pseudobutyrivibrio sp.]
MNCSILDCTLRDGAYIVNGNFGEKNISGIIAKLQDANIDLIECGWLKENEYIDGSSYFHVPNDLKKYVSKKTKQFILMIDYNRYDCNKMPQKKEGDIDAIRVVFPVGKAVEGINVASTIRNKGYKVYLQLANTSGYTDAELINVSRLVNDFRPEAVSIVDTFGKMYPWDLSRMLTILDHNLDISIGIGFHSHNNQQLSFAMAIQFIEWSISAAPERRVIVDGTLCGMGRGAGNACTELLANYMNLKYKSSYDMDSLMDCIDLYMSEFITKFNWGYSIPYALAGMYGCHVNNVAYLIDKHRTKAKDMRNIFDSLDGNKRIVYDYDNLERVYKECTERKADDTYTRGWLFNTLKGKDVLLLLPGKSVETKRKEIEEFIEKKKPFVIGVNSYLAGYEYDMVFFNNDLKFEYFEDIIKNNIDKLNILMTSNMDKYDNEKIYRINNPIGDSRWKYNNNSTIILLDLLKNIDNCNIYIAGFDGFLVDNQYASTALKANIQNSSEFELMQKELEQILKEFKMENSIDLNFITESPFEKYFN